MLEFLELLLLGDDGWCLQLVQIPNDFEGTTYGEVVDHLLTAPEPMHPLGVLRDCADDGDAPPDVVLPNPPAATSVGPADRLFVLARSTHERRL